MSHSRRRAGAGFTLVELLVVIAIIAILASLIAVAAIMALDKAKQTRIALEVQSLDAAIKAYVTKYGSQPPDFSDYDPKNPTDPTTAVSKHIAKAFPRYIPNVSMPPLPKDQKTRMSPAQALVFWLSGFDADPTDPFHVDANGKIDTARTRTPALFNFDKSRFKPELNPGQYSAQIPVYVPTGGQGMPYMYFDSRTYFIRAANGSAFLNAYNAGKGFCKPYMQSPNPYPTTPLPLMNNIKADDIKLVYMNPTTFQIISAGLDGDYGNADYSFFPNGELYNAGDSDNITNFCGDKTTLEDCKP